MWGSWKAFGMPHTKQLSSNFDYSVTHRHIRGDLISMFKLIHGVLGFPLESTFTHPTRIGLRGYAYKFHQRRSHNRQRQHAFSMRAIPFWNKLPALIARASPVKSFVTLMDANWQSLFTEEPVLPASTHSPFRLHIWPQLETHTHMNFFIDHPTLPSIAVHTAQ